MTLVLRLWLVLLSASFAACTTSPPLDHPREESWALRSDLECELAEHVPVDEEGQSHFSLLDEALDGLAVRLAMVDLAEHSIDAQYYIWSNDQVGRLFFERILAAADRGVRVRLLIDDFAATGSDKGKAAIDSHPNLELRVFNPVGRKLTKLGEMFNFVVDLDRLNHRMHNKVFVVDNRAAVVGGRNIADEYFGVNEKFDFRDMDALATGPVVADLSESFDAFWNCPWSVPGSAFVKKPPSDEKREKLVAKLREEVEEDDLVGQWPELRKANECLLEHIADLTPGRAVVVQDNPDIEDNASSVQMAKQLQVLGERVTKEILVTSAYFVPEDSWVERARAQTEKGIRIRLLTNSLASLDSSITNAVYKNYRKKLIGAGIELYEFRGDAVDRSHITGYEKARTGLHSKLAVYDDDLVCIGSMNLDPRSLELNTEIGVVVQSAELASRLRATQERDLAPENSWRVEVVDGELRWTSSAGTVDSQPADTLWQRLGSFFYSLLPVRSQV